MRFSERILLRSEKSWLLLNPAEILWIEARGHVSILHCGENQYSIRSGIRNIEGKLNPRQFIRIHRSCIVNMDTIRELKPRVNRGYDVILEDGTKLNWSRHYKNRFHLIEESFQIIHGAEEPPNQNHAVKPFLNTSTR
jgi:two-component system, LytTR family, response regulator